MGKQKQLAICTRAHVVSLKAGIVGFSETCFIDISTVDIHIVAEAQQPKHRLKTHSDKYHSEQNLARIDNIFFIEIINMIMELG